MKKTVSFALSLLLATGLLTSCAAGSGSSAQASGNAAPGASSSTAASGAKGDVTLQVYAGTALYADTVARIEADYKEQTGVNLEWEIPGDEPYTVLKTRFAADEAPDVFLVDTGTLGAWSERSVDLTGEPWVERTNEGALSFAQIDGKLAGMPLSVEASGFVYNKELFAQAGIEELPKTLNELEAVCQKLEAAGIQPFGEAYREWGFLMHIFGTPVAYEKDPKAFSEALNSGEKKIEDLTYIDNFFRVYDMTLDYGLGAESVGYDAMTQIADFAAGKMAMIKQGTWYGPPLLAANPDLQIGLMAIPLTENADETKLMTAPTGYLCVASTGRNEAEAKAFLTWLSDNAQTYLVEGLQVSPPYENMDLSSLGTLNTDMQQYMSDNMAFPVTGTEYLAPGFVTDIAAPLQAYAAKQLDQQGALDELQALYDNRLATTG